MNSYAQNILITGATSALAKAFIRFTEEKGSYRILAVSRSSDKVIQNPQRLEDYKSITGIDLTDENNLKALEDETRDFFKSCNKFNVIHFAGDFWRHKPLISTNFSEIKKMIDSHYITLCGVSKAITPVMMEKKAGRLIAFSCNSVGYNYPDMLPFTAAKAAVESFIKCYSNEYAPYGISATAIALPTMKTDEILAEKKDGDHENYLTPNELSEYLENLLFQPPTVTGNIIRLIKPSPTFYGKSYFERNPRKMEYIEDLNNAAKFGY